MQQAFNKQRRGAENFALHHATQFMRFPHGKGDLAMNSIIYLVGLVVVVMFVLSFLGLR